MNAKREKMKKESSLYDYDSEAMMETFHQDDRMSSSEHSAALYASIMESDDDDDRLDINSLSEEFEDNQSDIDGVLGYSMDDPPPVHIEGLDQEMKVFHDRMKRSVLHNSSQSQSPQLSIPDKPEPIAKTSPVKDKSPYRSTAQQQQHQISHQKSFEMNRSHDTQETVRYSLSGPDRREYETKIRHLERKVAELEETVQIAQRNEQHSKMACNNESELVRQLKESNEILNVTISGQIEQMNMLQQELRNQNNENMEKGNRILELERQIADIQHSSTTQINALKDKLRVAAPEIKRLRTALQKVKKEDATQYRHLVQQKENIITELRQTIDFLKENNDELESRCRTLFDENTSLRQQMLQMNEDKIRNEKEKDAKHQELVQVQAEFRQFETEFGKIKAKYDEFLHTYNSVVEERRKLKRDNETKALQIESLEMRLKNHMEKYRVQTLIKDNQDKLPLKLDRSPVVEVGEPKASPDRYSIITKKDLIGDARGVKGYTYSSPDKRKSSQLADSESKTGHKTELSRPKSASAASKRKVLLDESVRSADRVNINHQHRQHVPSSHTEADQRPSFPKEDEFERHLKTLAHSEDELSDTANKKDNDYLKDIPFYKDTRYLKQKLLTERKRIELKNVEIEGLKELLYKQKMREKKKKREEVKKKFSNELQAGLNRSKNT